MNVITAATGGTEPARSIDAGTITKLKRPSENPWTLASSRYARVHPSPSLLSSNRSPASRIGLPGTLRSTRTRRLGASETSASSEPPRVIRTVRGVRSRFSRCKTIATGFPSRRDTSGSETAIEPRDGARFASTTRTRTRSKSTSTRAASTVAQYAPRSSETMKPDLANP